ncbi:MAG TPA: formyltransferase family protein [Planctomycetota bacterium]|nr:formyltransferase family protein [Planctomycetota bacterium]
MPRVIAFVNGALGARALTTLGDALVAVVAHAPERRRDGDAILAAKPARVPLFVAPDVASADGIAALRALAPTHGLSVLFGHILRADALAVFPHGIANLHPSLLPAGRGAHPNAWAIARREPSGATLHLIDAGVDTGPILAQEAVPPSPVDSAATLHARLLDACARLLEREVPRWLAGALVARPQPAGGAARRVRDLDALLAVDAEGTYTGRELIDLLRARTFAPHPGAPYLCDGRRYRLRLEITEEP